MRNLTQTTNTLSDKRDGYELQRLLQDVYNRFRSCALTTAGLIIKAGGGTIPKTGAAASYYIAEGKTVTIAAGVDMSPVLTSANNITNVSDNIFVWSVDKDGTTYLQQGTTGTTLGTVRWPELDPTRAVIGAIHVAPSSGNFVGGTSALDGTLANTVYISPVGPFDPSANV